MHVLEVEDIRVRTILHVNCLPDSSRLRMMFNASVYACCSSFAETVASNSFFTADINSSNSTRLKISYRPFSGASLAKLLAIDAMSIIILPRWGIWNCPLYLPKELEVRALRGTRMLLARVALDFLAVNRHVAPAPLAITQLP